MTARIISLFFIVIVLAGVNYSCIEKKTVQRAESYADLSVDESSDIIEYTNGVNSLIGSFNRWQTGNAGAINEVICYAIGEESESDAPNMASYTDLEPNKYLDVIPKSITREDSIFFQQNVTAFQNSVKLYKERFTELQRYYGLKRFGLNPSAKTAVDTLLLLELELSNLQSALYAKIETLGNIAENVILASHPLKDAVIAMREDMELYLDLCRLFDDYNYGNSDPEELEAAYKKLALNIDNHKDKYYSEAKKYQNGIFYSTFYKAFEDSALPEAQKLIEGIRNGEIENEGDCDTEPIWKAYDQLILQYNRFVN